MLSILSTTGRLVARTWAPLLAWFLAGYLVHYVVIEIAGFVGASSSIGGLAIMPLAVVARLASYIAMFFVLRRAMPAFRSLERKGQVADDLGDPAAPQRISDVLLVSILPFFAFYAAWKYLDDDTQQYATSALSNLNPFDGPQTGNVLDLELTPLTLGIILVALGVRYVIKTFADTLPKWMNVVAVYVEALWVYLAVLIVGNYADQVNSWVGSRAAVGWYEGAKQGVLDFFAPLGWLWSGVEAVLGEVSGLVLLPIAWLAIAGVVYGKALSASATVKLPGRLSRLTARLPPSLARRGRDIGEDFAARWRPLANALVLIWRAGVVPVGCFVLLYVALDAVRYWIILGATRIVGPHDLMAWWFNFDDILLFLVQVLVEPLRVALIAATYDYCLRKLDERREAVATAPAAGSGAALPRARG